MWKIRATRWEIRRHSWEIERSGVANDELLFSQDVGIRIMYIFPVHLDMRLLRDVSGIVRRLQTTCLVYVAS